MLSEYHRYSINYFTETGDPVVKDFKTLEERTEFIAGKELIEKRALQWDHNLNIYYISTHLCEPKYDIKKDINERIRLALAEVKRAQQNLEDSKSYLNRTETRLNILKEFKE